MKKSLILSILVFISPFAAGATAECEFIPSTVKVGETGNNENKLFVCDQSSAWTCYYLGEADNERAKARYSAAMTALASGKRLRLRFYGREDCESAKTDFALPNATWLRQ
ncbi:hypothetical protein tloyanaT_07780 [Thalassotalea loyana]|uniref:Uncharacterized protein n=1 Tax=Thalassotalea loyana TaxID=280483 RepID=A0ABQ6HCC3_9GAMM|nr:hypothetical protein [Thalassotalea loyana]GLX84526.1 hypothetical protein tloyanaT_07780 [Thalassotalea loyana]